MITKFPLVAVTVVSLTLSLVGCGNSATPHASSQIANVREALSPVDQQVFDLAYSYFTNIAGVVDLNAPAVFTGPLGKEATELRIAIGGNPPPSRYNMPMYGSAGALWFEITQLVESNKGNYLVNDVDVAALRAARKSAKADVTAASDDTKAIVYLTSLQKIYTMAEKVLETRIIPLLEKKPKAGAVTNPVNGKTVSDLAQANITEVKSRLAQLSLILAGSY